MEPVGDVTKPSVADPGRCSGLVVSARADYSRVTAAAMVQSDIRRQWVVTHPMVERGRDRRYMPWRLEMGLAGKSLAPVPSERSSPVGIAQTCRISVTANKPDSNIYYFYLLTAEIIHMIHRLCY